MSYVDGFVLPVYADRVEEYHTIAEKASKIWMEYGALDYKECVAEDMEDKGFCMTFPQLVTPAASETIVFAFITFRNRAHRDEVNAKVMADERMTEACDPENMPFDCKRMAYGGFRTIVEGKR